jgi:hypothetical protein
VITVTGDGGDSSDVSGRGDGGDSRGGSSDVGGRGDGGDNRGGSSNVGGRGDGGDNRGSSGDVGGRGDKGDSRGSGGDVVGRGDGGDSRGSNGDVGGRGDGGDSDKMEKSVITMISISSKWQDTGYWRERPTGNDNKRTKTNDVLDAEYTENQNINEENNYDLYLLTGNAIKCPCLILNVSVEVSPEFDEKESILWAFIVQFLQATLFFREFVIDLPYIYSLQTENKKESTSSKVKKGNGCFTGPIQHCSLKRPIVLLPLT